MNDVPSWLWITWLIISSLSFLIMLVVGIALLFVIVKKVLPALDDVMRKVQILTDKMDKITTSAKSTVDTIQAKTTSIMGTAEDASVEMAKKVGSASAAISLILIGFKLYTAFKGMRHHENPIEKK
ncbi:MAG: hypothetical protein ABJA67_03105 [Chthonomonadales bacterium]